MPSRFFARTAKAAVLVLALVAGSAADAAELAKNLFGAEKLPAVAAPQSIGFYSRGCFTGGVALPAEGPDWQVMRVSRNRRWGHPAMIGLIEKFARDAASRDGWPGLLIGDVSQPRGGPMVTGHASHQIGLDADIWFMPMPAKPFTREQRETVSAISMIKDGGKYVDNRVWTGSQAKLLKRVAGYPEVERILVNPGIKKKLCETVSGDRGWLNKIRPFWGHDTHFHVRVGCQPGSPDCKEQAAVPPGDGCDKLAWWFTKAAELPADNDETPKARDKMTMSSLPKACQAVLDAPSPASVASVTFGGDTVPAVTAPAVRASGLASAPRPPASVGSVAGGGSADLPVNAFGPTPESGVPLPQPRPRR